MRKFRFVAPPSAGAPRARRRVRAVRRWRWRRDRRGRRRRSSSPSCGAARRVRPSRPCSTRSREQRHHGRVRAEPNRLPGRPADAHPGRQPARRGDHPGRGLPAAAGRVRARIISHGRHGHRARGHRGPVPAGRPRPRRRRWRAVRVPRQDELQGGDLLQPRAARGARRRAGRRDVGRPARADRRDRRRRRDPVGARRRRQLDADRQLRDHLPEDERGRGLRHPLQRRRRLDRSDRQAAIDKMLELYTEDTVDGGIDGATVDALRRRRSPRSSAPARRPSCTTRRRRSAASPPASTSTRTSPARRATAIDWFPFPTIDGNGEGLVTWGGDQIGALVNDTDVVGVHGLHAEHRGGRGVGGGGHDHRAERQRLPTDAYPNVIMQKDAELINSAEALRFDGSDLLPGGRPWRHPAVGASRGGHGSDPRGVPDHRQYGLGEPVDRLS